MNKYLLAVALAFCVALAHGGRVQEDIPEPLNTHADGREYIQLVAHTFPPFQYKENERMVGPVMEIMRRVCEEANVNCFVHMHAFKDAYKDVLGGEVDAIFTFLLADEDDRRSLFAYSPPMVVTKYSFFVSSTSNWEWRGKISDLDGRTVGVHGPSGTHMVARDLVSQNSTAKLILEETNIKAFQSLVIGRYGQKAAIVSNRDVGLALLKNSNIQGPKLAGDISSAVFGFGFSKSSKAFHLYPRLSAAVQSLKGKGIIQGLLKPYGLEPAP